MIVSMGYQGYQSDSKYRLIKVLEYHGKSLQCEL